MNWLILIEFFLIGIVVVQSLSHVWLFETSWTAAHQAYLSFKHLLEFAQTHVHWVSDAINHLILCHPPSPPTFNLSEHRGLFQWFGSSRQMAKVLELLQHQSFSEYSGLISFRIDWFDLPAVQGTLKSLLQHHSSKASILQHSAFFIVQLSHPYMPTRKTIALTRWTFVSKTMSLLFNMLSMLVISDVISD